MNRTDGRETRATRNGRAYQQGRDTTVFALFERGRLVVLAAWFIRTDSRYSDARHARHACTRWAHSSSWDTKIVAVAAEK
jgi:hypothetical protein